jgi:RNA polymerase sigma-70 factor, ECF subfamily
MMGDVRRLRRMSAAQRDEALANLVLRTTPLVEDEVLLLYAVFDDISNAHFPSVWRQVARRVPEAAVSDVVQESLISVFERLLSGFPTTSLRKLIHVIAARRIADWLRSNKHEGVSVALPSSATEQPRSSVPGTERLLALRERGARLFARLSPEHREVMVLCVVHELSSEEAGKRLGLPAATVRTRLRAAKRALEELAKEMLPPSERNAA